MPRLALSGRASRAAPAPDRRHPGNRLNDLTNREWLIATKSVWYSRPAARDRLKVRHPATFAETDVAALIRFFTKRGERVLDPFLGTGSALLACRAEGRRGVGIELLPEWVQVARERLGLDFGDQQVIAGDAREAVAALPEEGFDFVVTSPPYWQILRKDRDHKATRERKARGLRTRYSDAPEDLGNHDSYDGFRAELRRVWAGCFRALRAGRYLAVVVSDFRHRDRFIPYHAHTAEDAEAAGFALQGITVLVQDNKALYPYGMPHAFVSNVHHQYILVLRKPRKGVRTLFRGGKGS
jgi:DNA modification methylase